jgi:hypothetical protein
MLEHLRPPVYRDRYTDAIGPVVCMTTKNDYVMCRRPRMTPFVISLAEWHERAGTQPTAKALHPSLKLLLKALESAPNGLTNTEIQAAVSLKERTVREWITRLKKAGKVYIKSWLPPDTTGRHTPVFALGAEKSVTEPKFNRKKAHARYRQKHRKLINVRQRKTPLNPFEQLIAK